ncbi:MAG: DegV family protein, partial [Oscillospiraceae bacterium]
MGKTLLLCDSTCDLSVEQEQKFGLRVIDCGVELGGLPYRERSEIDSAKIYASVEKTGVLPHHSQITVIEFLEEFARAARDGYTDLLCVTMNAAGSGTHSAALHAVGLLPVEYPAAAGLRIRVIDTRTYSLPIAAGLLRAAEQLKKGAGPDEVGDWLEDFYRSQITLVGLYSLEYAKKSGRLGACAAIVGEALGIKPIMAITGENRVIDKTRGDKNLIPKLVQLYLKLAEDPENGDYIVAYGSNPEQAKQLIAAL